MRTHPGWETAASLRWFAADRRRTRTANPSYDHGRERRCTVVVVAMNRVFILPG